MRVIFTGGGTGGHVYPIIALAEEFSSVLKGKADLLFVGTKDGKEAELVPREGYKFTAIRAGGVMGKGKIAKAGGMLKIAGGIFDSLNIMKRFKPDIVIASGGYVSVPVSIAAILANKKFILIEPNSIPGAANKMLAPFASSVIGAFEETGRYFKTSRYQALGAPVRKKISALAGSYKPDTDKILIFGGSAGASAINKTLIDALKLLTGSGIKFIHQTGKNDFKAVKAAYEKAGLQADVKEYIYDMVEEYKKASLVICRAGAATIAELAAFGMPAILIPYPYAIYNHQQINAQSLQGREAAFMMLEKDLTAGKLAETILILMNNKEKLVKMSEASLNAGKRDAAIEIVEYCIKIAGKKSKKE